MKPSTTTLKLEKQSFMVIVRPQPEQTKARLCDRGRTNEGSLETVQKVR